MHYTIRAKASDATGTAVSAQATVVFDTNAAAEHQHDHEHHRRRAAQEQRQPAARDRQPRPSLSSWPGRTTPAAPASPPTTFSFPTTAAPSAAADRHHSDLDNITTAPFGHTYGFYSVATDNVGNVKPAPSGAQATTYVAGLPTSTVTPLPATTTTTSLIVSWSGTPGAGATRITSYEIFVSDNGGPFTLFLTSTTQTSASFIGQAGHRYSFFSVATSNLGLVQPAPIAGQATTQVALPAPPPLVTVTNVQDVTNKKHEVIQIIITFSGALNVAEADQIGTYRLATPGKKGSYTAKSAGILKLKSARYSETTENVTLTPKKPFPLTKPVQLVVYGSGQTALQDSLGRFIHGGTNAVALLRRAGVTVTAVLSNPTDVRQALEPSVVDVVLARETSKTHVHRKSSHRSREG